MLAPLLSTLSLESIARTAAGHMPKTRQVEMGAGHQGPSGRYDVWRDEARVQAFILMQLGLA